MKCKSLKKIRSLQLVIRVFVLFFTVSSFAAPVAKDTSKLILINSDVSVSVDQVFSLIKNQTSYRFIYNENHVKGAPKIFLQKGTISVPRLLKKTLDPINSTFEFDNNTIIVKKKVKSVAQEKITINGLVSDKDNQPIPGVTVLVRGTLKGVATDFEGKFKIKAPVNGVLVFSSIGYVEKEVTVTSNSTTVNVTLEEDVAKLEEVLINTGYQKLKPNEVAGSYTQVDMKQFERKMTPSITSAIEGLSPGLVISTNPATGSKILTIRGISTLEGEATPLIILDGFPYNGDLESINPYDVESITLLKDAASASIYGAKSANGIIVIVTKKGYNGKVDFRYTRNYEVTAKPDLDYVMNRVSSSDMVDIQTGYFNTYQNRLNSYQQYVDNSDPFLTYRMRTNNRTVQLLLAHKEGRISQQELDRGLNALKSNDNTQELENLLIQSPFVSQHDLSASYGQDNFRLRTSLNYTNSNAMKKGSKNDAINYNLNTIVDFNDKVSLDMSANIRLAKSESNKDRLRDFFRYGSYDRLYDDSGNALPVTRPTLNLSSDNQGRYGGIDAFANQQRVALGLLDLTYYPALDFGRSTNSENIWSARAQAQMKVQLLKGLDAKLGVSYRVQGLKNNIYSSDKSWEMRSLINNLTQVNDDGTKGDLLIPLGGRLYEKREDQSAYLFRGQLDYVKELDKHKITALLGSEVQSIKTTSTSVDRVGYDINSNSFKQVDYATLGQSISNVFLPGGGRIGGGVDFDNSFRDVENRYFSVFTNGNYTYDKKYVLSASARIDQSNLFGTDPKYRFKPFWSVAGQWHVDQEKFFKSSDIMSRLSLQMSYGTNGNISNTYGPYDIARNEFSYRANQAPSLSISSYAVPDLRWEKTGTFNVGVNTILFKDKINLSFDYYRKKTQDVLATAEADPTLGSNFVVRNDATILNNGYELTLSSRNVHTDNFTWRSFLNLRFNKSKVEKIYKTDDLAYFIAGRVVNRLGYEPNSIFVFDWAGVNDQGDGQVRTSNGDLMAISPSIYQGGTFNPQDLKDADLQYAGTTIPKTVLGFTNNLEYKNMSLSFLLVYQGGHVMRRDSYDGGFVGGGVSLINREASLAWKEPGDENRTVVPRISSASYSSIAAGSSKNIISGDFLALRDVVFSYTLRNDFLKKLKIKELTLNVKGGNLYKWTKNKYNIDPETQGLGFRRFAVQKSVSSGFIVTF